MHKLFGDNTAGAGGRSSEQVVDGGADGNLYDDVYNVKTGGTYTNPGYEEIDSVNMHPCICSDNKKKVKMWRRKNM